MPTENNFRKLLREQVNATRAGLYGQFEHAWNFDSGNDADSKIGPGESIDFAGELLGSGQAVTMTVTNNLTGPSGQGFHGQTVDPSDPTIIVGDAPATGQATLAFDVPGGGGSGGLFTTLALHVTSPRSVRGYDAADMQVLLAAPGSGFGGGRHPVRSAAGDTYMSQARGRKYQDPSTLIWQGTNPPIEFRADEGVAHDPTAGPNGVVAMGSKNQSFFFSQDLCGLDASTGAVLWTFYTGASSQFSQIIHDVKSDENGFFYVAVRSNSSYTDAGPVASVFKINSTTGVVVASFDTDLPTSLRTPGPQIRLAVELGGGEVVVTQPKATSGHSGTGAFAGVSANVWKFNASFSLIATLVDLPDDATERNSVKAVTMDQNGNVYILDHKTNLKRYNTTLTGGPVWTKLIRTVPPFHGDIDVGVLHDQNNTLHTIGVLPYIAPIAPATSGRTTVGRFSDVDGTGIGDLYVPRSPTDNFLLRARWFHIRPAGGGEPSNNGDKFTQEFSTNPPGNVEAIAAIKYVDGDITSIFWNSVDCEFDPSKWTATHSVGSRDVLGDWNYNSIL